MLADIKPEIKIEAHLPNKQVERLQPQTVVPPPKPTRIHENISHNAEEESVVNFGWEEVKNGFIPFVKRGSENYVAIQIVAELVYKQVQKEFSKDILYCMALIMERMSQKEADAFNDININHSDKTVVGNYYFKVNEFMIRLEYVKKLVNYFDACRSLLLNKIKENNLFGFIQVASKNQVPFVWNNDRKLMPLFYFEGQSEYLDARSIDITDPFKIGYLKFCCKVQKIKKDYYEQNPLKVVDFEDVRKLFPAETTFEVSLPEKVNQDLFAPEVRLALLHEMNNSLDVSLSSGQKPNENGINLNKPVPGDPIMANLTVESNNQEDNTRAPKRPLQTSNDVGSKRLKMHATKSTLQSRTFTPEANKKSHTLACENVLSQHPDAQNTNQTLLDFSRLSQDNTVTPVYYQQPYRQQSDSRRNSGLSTINPAASSMDTNQDMPTSSPASNSQITNVPYRSPRSASSPGFPQVNQVINGAAQIVPEYQQTSTKVTNQPKPQESTIRTSGTYQPVRSHEEYVAGNGQEQLNCGSVPYYAQRQHTTSRQQQSYTYSAQRNSDSSLSNASETTCYQSPAFQITSTQINYYQPAPTNATMQFQDLRLNQHPLANRSQREQYEYWQKYQQQTFQGTRPMPQRNGFAHPTQPLMQLNGLPPHRAIITPNENFQSYTNTVFTGHQTNPSLYRQQYSGGFPSSSSPLNATRAPAYSFSPQEVNNSSMISNVELTPTVLEHPQCIDAMPEFYVVKTCVVRGKPLLGISKSPIAQSFLINLSEFVEKVLGLNPFANQTELTLKFKTLYNLNPIQKVQWDRVSHEKQLQFVGPLKDVFVDYKLVTL